jgi:polar amino acid transport system substrate-binding protein
MIFPDVVADDRYGFAVTKGSSLADEANDILNILKESGTISELENIWFSSDESKKVLPKLDYKDDFDGSAGTLKYGCDSTTVPMSYLGSDGKPLGFDLAIVSSIAYELNMNIEFVPMNFDALLVSLASGKVDMVGGSMSITEERQKSVDFVGPYFEGGVVLVIKKERLGK